MNDVHDRPPWLVLGLGNPLLRDDGAGLELLRALESDLGGDPRFELVDGGTQGVGLVPCFEGRRGVLLLDAVRRGSEPGTIHVSDAASLEAPERGLTAHEGNAHELLGAVRLTGTHAGPVVLVGIEPRELRTGLGLSAPVRDAVRRAVPVARSALARLLRGTVSHEEDVACTR